MKITIILPTYNRARFLESALGSIQSQTFRDWELIVVDDGSTDETRELLDRLLPSFENSVRYHYQENAGVGGARNCGLALARGEQIAFFDSDDLWSSTHLEDLHQALEAHPDIDWVFCNGQRVEAGSGKVLLEDFFERSGRRLPFVAERRVDAGRVHKLVDTEILQSALQDEIPCWLQASLIRRRVFERLQFWEEFRVLEDVFLILRALTCHFKFAYLENKNIIIQLHDDHTSLAGEAYGMAERDIQRAQTIYKDVVDAWLRFCKTPGLTRPQRRVIRRRVASLCFWNLGYATYWMHGEPRLAREAFRRALGVWPYDPRMWKTYLCCSLKKVYLVRDHAV